MAVPPFFSCVPISVPSSLNSLFVSPTDVAASLDHCSMSAEPALNTVWIAPTDCSRSDA